MFSRIARVVGNLFTVVEDAKPSNRVRLACESLEDRFTPATFTVDSASDFPDDDAKDGKAGYVPAARVGWEVSLRSAIMQGNWDAANGKGKDHTIEFAKGISLISLTKALPTLAANFKITGGEAVVTVERPVGAAQFRIFDIGGANWEVVLEHLGIRGGSVTENGGGIHNAGRLTIEDCEIYNNYSADGGGGIFSSTHLYIGHSQIWNNTAVGLGGGILVSGGDSFELSESEVYDNVVEATAGKALGYGGGLWLSGSASVPNFVASIHDSSIYDNTAASHGGGFYAFSRVEISDCDISFNTAGGDGGGGYLAVSKGAICKWIGGTVADNKAGGKGGGFYVEAGLLQFENPVSFTNNQATKFAGGAYLPPNGDATTKGLGVGFQTVDADQ